MKFRFPIFIIDEDYRSENASGLGIRALSAAIEAEGVEVIATSYGDLSSFAQQQSRASAFILSIDDEEFDVDSPEDVASAIKNLRTFIGELCLQRLTSPSTCTARRAPRNTFRTTSCASCMASSTCSRTPRIRGAPHHPRGAQLRRQPAAAVLPRAGHEAQDGLYSWHRPGHRRRGVPEEPGGPDVPPVLRRNMLRADVCNAVDELGQLLDHTGPVAESELNAARIFHADHRFFVTRYLDLEQGGAARQRRRRRRGGGGPQLPQVDPARHHHDGRDSGVPASDAQPPGDHRPDPAGRVPSGQHPQEDRGQPVRAKPSTRTRAS